MTEPRFSAVDHALMARALRLAAQGIWTADPNPRVGCVIAHGERIVGEGWHERTGGPHAEAAALEQAGGRARGATAYVTLEPCSHHGRTPPCTDALIEAGVVEVVCAIGDPHPAVDGDGIRRLADAGIAVRVGLMEVSARALNPGFLSRFERGRPYVRAKLAGSLDGRSRGADGESKWITAEPARRDGHRWRARAGAILTGIETVLADDPALDVRLSDFRKTPRVVVADSRGRLPAGARLLATGAPVLHATLQGGETPPGCERIELPDDGAGRLDPFALLAELARREVNELHVEAGPVLTGALLASGLVDELVVYSAACLVGADGGPLVRLPGVEKFDQRLHFNVLERRAVGQDWRVRLAPVVGSR
ncbi:MAG: bifunctional diaminohydroxyphosphoribosylaminopyrimidine deaminase/5-amino-6-(5-phosphoribosylamino)uracil reductase RibD [Candidatus Wenzhouxiangella sp. M2_3B_020]